MKTDSDTAAIGNLPPCSLIIATRDRPRLVVDAVRSVLEGRRVPAELVVVDQSLDPDPDLAALAHAECEIRIVRSPARGLSAARNIGIREATHDILAFTDDDVLVDPGWLEALVGTLARGGERTAVVGRVMSGPAEVEGAAAVSATPAAKVEFHEGRLIVDPLAGGNCAFFRSALDDVGAFDERLGAGARFPGAEDNDLGFRLLEVGYAIRYVSEAVVVHRAWRAGGELCRLAWGYGRGQGAFLAKHFKLRDAHMLKRFATTVSWHQPFRRSGSLRDAAYLVGFLSGAAEWAVTERLLRGLTARTGRLR
jgi:GT2 family glycosyltransferase